MRHTLMPCVAPAAAAAAAQNALLTETPPYYNMMAKFAAKGPLAAVLYASSGKRPALPTSDVVPADSPLRKLVTDCWDADPTRRPTMRRVLEVLKDCPFEDRDLNEEA